MTSGLDPDDFLSRLGTNHRKTGNRSPKELDWFRQFTLLALKYVIRSNKDLRLKCFNLKLESIYLHTIDRLNYTDSMNQKKHVRKNVNLRTSTVF